MQTYTNAIESLLGQSVMLPPELLTEVEKFIEEKRHLEYTTKEEFLRDTARWRLKSLSDEYEYVKVRKDVYEKLGHAMKEMDLPFVGVSDFIDQQIKNAQEKYAEWKEQAEENEKRS